VAFLYRGICKFEEKVILAAEAGAAVIVIVNNNPEGVITMSIGSKPKFLQILNHPFLEAEEYKVISLMISNKSGYQILQVLKDKVDYENIFLKVSKGVSQNKTVQLAKFECQINSQIFIKSVKQMSTRIEIQAPTVGFEKIIVIVICLAFLVLLTISLAWVIFYYVQRFRLLHQQYRVIRGDTQIIRNVILPTC